MDELRSASTPPDNNTIRDSIDSLAIIPYSIPIARNDTHPPTAQVVKPDLIPQKAVARPVRMSKAPRIPNVGSM